MGSPGGLVDESKVVIGKGPKGDRPKYLYAMQHQPTEKCWYAMQVDGRWLPTQQQSIN